MPPVLRILDANANRAREALRVMEEAARFLLDDAELSAQLKTLRHGLAQALEPFPHLMHHRDTPGDVGTSITTPGEATRSSAPDVVVAAGKRLTEALRALEEYGKLTRQTPGGADFPQQIEALRYRAYDIEMALGRAMGAGEVKQWRLCLLLTEALCRPHPWDTVLDAAMRAGADCIQVREKQMDGGPLRNRIAQVVAKAAGKAAVIVNDRPDIALAAGADGAHLAQHKKTGASGLLHDLNRAGRGIDVEGPRTNGNDHQIRSADCGIDRAACMRGSIKHHVVGAIILCL